MRSNSLPIATIRNAARRKRQRAIQVVATHPAGELSKTIKQDVDQNVNTSSKRSTAESRIILNCGLYQSIRPRHTGYKDLAMLKRYTHLKAEDLAKN